MHEWQLFVTDRDIRCSESILIEFCARHAQFETRTEAPTILSRFLCSVLPFRHMADSNVQGNTTASLQMFSRNLFTLN